MASEFFAEGGNGVAITLTPGGGGVFQVYVDGEKLFDKKEEGLEATLTRVKQLRAQIKEKLSKFPI